MATQGIQSDPNVMMGKPVVEGTRITVESILEELGAGQTIEQLLKAHPRLTRGGFSPPCASAPRSCVPTSPTRSPSRWREASRRRRRRAAIVARLRGDGHDVVYVAELSPGITDGAVLELANADERRGHSR